MERFLFNLKIALDALIHNKLRSLLTALGIIFGVASVIAMLAIGEGARQEILEQIRLVGVNNILIQQKIKKDDNTEEQNSGGKKEKKELSLGLTMQDGETIKRMVPEVARISPVVEYESFALRKGMGNKARLVGVMPDYFTMHNLEFVRGNIFNYTQTKVGEPVCVIGSGIKTKFFSQEDALGKEIKCGKIWLRVIGVLENRNVGQAAMEGLGISDFNMDIYVPVNTVLLRYKDRSLITKQNFGNENEEEDEKATKEKLNKTYNQIDKLIVQVNETEYLQPVTNVINRMLQRRHNGVADFEITVPELLLKQQQRTKDIFNIVLGVIAGISLLVGGIGIMNIMLVSVMERLKEIGLRMALGATKKDVVLQFLAESMLISLMGGIAGIILGVLISFAITKATDILTIVTVPSVLLSFSVAASVGLIFGIVPARKAALQDPISSLRYE